MEIPTMASPTLGTRLDAAIHHIDSMSSMQLYAVIVGLTIVIAMILLGSENGPETELQVPSELKVKSSIHNSSAACSQKAIGPEPRWHIFRYVNTAVVAVFGWSVADFTLHCTAYLNDSDTLLKFLLGWSVLLCYCFGFFGISFVHDTIVEPKAQATETAR
jgi:hypothetical protein